MSTVAPAITAPVGSVTDPCTVPKFCAKPARPKHSHVRAANPRMPTVFLAILKATLMRDQYRNGFARVLGEIRQRTGYFHERAVNRHERHVFKPLPAGDRGSARPPPDRGGLPDRFRAWPGRGGWNTAAPADAAPDRPVRKDSLHRAPRGHPAG